MEGDISMKEMLIGRLAKNAGVSVQAVRYYERVGLLPAPERRESGYRVYSGADAARLGFIKKAQALGFSLKEIGAMLEERDREGISCIGVKRLVERKLARIDEKIRDLKELRESLRAMHSGCDERLPVEECPVLRVIEAGSKRERFS